MIQAEEAETFVGRVLSASRDQRQAEAQEELRKTKLRKTIAELDLPRDEREAFQSFLMRFHHAFSLEDGEQGETVLIRMEIDTGDAYPKKQRARRLPFALGVIQLSKSPWASFSQEARRDPLDYRGIIVVTKTDADYLPETGRTEQFLL